MNRLTRTLAAAAASAVLLALSASGARADDHSNCGMAYNPCYTNRTEPYMSTENGYGWTVSDVVLSDGRRIRCIMNTSYRGQAMSCDWGAK